MSSYAALSLMGIPTEAEVAAQERDEAERLLAMIEEEQAMLAEAREEAREEQEQARREMEQELRRRQDELEAEVERLRAEAEARAALQEETVDEEGATPDDEVFVDPEGSSASRSRNFDTFAETARQTVRRWEFEFDNPDEHCLRRQERSIAFEFQYD